MKIADNYGNIAATLKQIEADKVKMLKGKPAEVQPTPDELSLLQASLQEKNTWLLKRVDAATLKQIEADKAKARSKPAEPETKSKTELGDFDPA